MTAPRACLILLMGLLPAAGSVPGSFERTFQVSGPVTLDVRSDPGGMNIHAGSSAQVRVRATIKPRYGRVDLDLAEANIRALEKNPPVEQQGNLLRIGYPKDPGLLRGVTIHFDIEAPQSTEVRAFTQSGGIRIDGLKGPVASTAESGRTEIGNIKLGIKAATTSGAIEIRGAGADVSAEATSGGISILDAAGSVAARNGSGKIDALNLRGSVQAETRSGAIRISQLSAAPVKATAGSGSIKAALAQGGYEIDARSHSGKVQAPDSIMSRRTPDGHALRARLGSGGPPVDLSTRSSAITIEQP